MLCGSGSDCHIHGSIMFARVLALVAPTRGAMQLMTSNCDTLDSLDLLAFNTKFCRF